ncbi:(2Fe-2S)-binding protein [Domibacillus enclensis]|uniref:Xanthine dehydrogenase molybdenum-binding subunit/carbon-monoxide dehydrogenase small subunit n=1 Tax=Domibacillus enclensis TaxID=1017273 RepID=A0A1N7BAB7_9BACI|nr:(2Fe-2S)-binding protein [Domibacillus enclensis]OXS74651.1 xanthine dehydrogenase subunit E [Domibacillus enclensis]SIR48267.1 xanthine dehydrogenase molybdenum-binding subunit/carbon-monoxide dehydrogenase small subunit [Domibacillus enclensis]
MEVNHQTAGRAEVLSVSFHLNGELVQVNTSPVARVVDVLRDELDQTGTKLSCGIGRCGACSILVNGKLTVSCLLLAYQLDGASVTTIEGLSGQGEMDPVQEAFLEEGGFQCGYCTPGMVMAVKSLLDSNHEPDQHAIQGALAGNLCRCTGYGGIIRSVQCAAAKRNAVR